MHLDPGEARVRPREVEELGDAECAAAGGRDRLARAYAFVVDDDELARRELPLEVGADEIECAGLGGQ